MLYAADFRSIARQALQGRWGLAVLAGFLASLLGASITGSSSPSFNFSFGSDDIGGSGYLGRGFSALFNSSVGQWLIPLLIGLVGVFAMWGLVVFIIGGAVTLGYARFNLGIVDGQEVYSSDIFSDFRIGAGLCMQLLRGIYTFLWTLLFIIPGIMAAYSYALTPYIMAEHPEYGANEAIRRSKEMMYGHRMRLFCLEMSFIGWSILCVLTFGIGFLWLIPYKEAACAAFYREISGTVPDYQAGSYSAY